MGFLGIFFFIFLVTGLLGFYFLSKSKKGDDAWMFFGTLGCIIGGLGSLICGFILVTDIYSYFMRTYDKQNELFNRTALTRMLDEKYDPDNLDAALNFNIKQKKASYYNNSALFMCWTVCYSVDTIPIPTSTYMPANMIKLDAVIDHLVDKMGTTK